MSTVGVPVLALAVTVLVGGAFAAGVGVMQLSGVGTPGAQNLVLAGAEASGSGTGPTSAPGPLVSSGPSAAPTSTSTSIQFSPAPTRTPTKAPTKASTKARTSKRISTQAAAAAPNGTRPWVVDGFAARGSGTTGGAAGQTVTVSTAAALKQYAAATRPYVIKVSGVLRVSGQIDVTSDKTIVGAGAGAGLRGGGLNVRKAQNVIIANLTIRKAKGTDAVSVWGSNHVLITHNDLSSDLSHGKGYYDGLVDITQGSDEVTVSYNRFHDHFKVVLIGHSDSNAEVDTGKLRVTVHHNSFTDVGSRLPSLRFGTGHVYNNVFTDVLSSAIHSRMGAVILAQNNVFTRTKNPYVSNADSDEPGTILTDPSPAPSWPYRYTLDAKSAVAGIVAGQAGPS
jgi:pectate lyase